MNLKLCIGMLITVLYDGVNGGVHMKLRMEAFDSGGVDSEGKSCDIIHKKACDPMFKFCLDGYASLDYGIDHCDIRQFPRTDEYDGQNQVSFPQVGYLSGNNVYNPLEPVQPLEVYEGFRLKAKVYDNDSGHSSHDDIDEFTFDYNERPAKSSTQAVWVPFSIPGTRNIENKAQLTFSVMVYCEDNYYGFGCDVYCVAADNDVGGHYTCDPDTGDIVCRPGWESPEEKCTILEDNCASFPCYHRGICVDKYDDFQCVCHSGYAGKDCQINVDECSSSPCLNGGICVDHINGYTCICGSSYTGQYCQQKITSDVCLGSVTCLNGGRCLLDNGQDRCFCPPEYTGSSCELGICSVIQCENGGSCINGQCQCTDNYVGPRCDTDLCSGVVCTNGGTCHMGTCVCTSGYNTDTCDSSSPCDDEPCQHDGTCYDLGSGRYVCRCLPQYNGTNCDYRLEPIQVISPSDQESNPVILEKGTPVWVIILIALIAVLIAVIVIVAALFFRYKRRKEKMARTTQTQLGHNNPVFSTQTSPHNTVMNENEYDNHINSTCPPPYMHSHSSPATIDPGPIHKHRGDLEGAVGGASTSDYDNPKNISTPYRVTSTTRENFGPDKWTPVKNPISPSSDKLELDDASFLRGAVKGKKSLFEPKREEDPYFQPLSETQESNILNSIIDKDRD